MEQFVPADWRSSNSIGDALAPSRGQDGGLLWCGMHSQPPWEHEAAPWFQYPVVVDDPLERDLFSEIFGEMQEAGSDTAGDREPPRASGATSCRDGSMMVTSSLTRPKPPGAASRSSVKRKRRDTAESPGEVMPDAEESDSGTDAVTTRGLAQKTTTGKRRRAAQEHNLSERRRRDRINEKMRALQELVPHSNKTDKASMLDEAIEYLKSLQLQVQIMWTTGGGMAPAPAMFPASRAHRYMQRMAPTRSRMSPFRTCVYTCLNDTKLS